MICETQEFAIEKYGENVSGVLMDILSDLEVAANISEIISGRPQQRMIGEVLGYQLSLPEGYTINIVSGHPVSNIDKNGQVDWSKVSRVLISSVEKS